MIWSKSILRILQFSINIPTRIKFVLFHLRITT
nr:MAG TPA: hypothetical protein [Caudoviricetes sp.]